MNMECLFCDEFELPDSPSADEGMGQRGAAAFGDDSSSPTKNRLYVSTSSSSYDAGTPPSLAQQYLPSPLSPAASASAAAAAAATTLEPTVTSSPPYFSAGATGSSSGSHRHSYDPPSSATVGGTPGGGSHAAAGVAPSSRTMDILAAVFFVVAAGWLLIALLYSCLAVAFLRLRARGQLDSIYEEDFGRLYLLPNSRRFYIPLGCLLRRYIAHIQRDQHRTRNGGRGGEDGQAPSARFMTRDERRSAIEAILASKDTAAGPAATSSSVAVGGGGVVDPRSPTGKVLQDDVDLEKGAAASGSGVTTARDLQLVMSLSGGGGDLPSSPTSSAGDASCAGPLCSICLGNYEPNEHVLVSKTCSHVFHKDCILDWLQRRNHECACPCCRIPMVDEDAVWKAVKRIRKQKRRDRKKQRRQQARQKQDKDGSNGRQDESVTTTAAAEEVTTGNATERTVDDADDVEAGEMVASSMPSEAAAAAPVGRQSSSSTSNNNNNRSLDDSDEASAKAYPPPSAGSTAADRSGSSSASSSSR